jgi:RNA polymerase sigma-70 factor, ECF subfamily
MVSPQQVTVLLQEWSRGNQTALNQLIPLVEAELHRLARQYISREHPGHTLQTTALVNEAYLRLVQVHDVHWQNRAHFFAISERIVRRIMIEHARKRQQLKRGGGALRITLDEGAILADERSAELLALDESLEVLNEKYPRKAQVVELRFFGGLTVTEAATVLKVDERTVNRHWEFAPAWLHQRINGGAGEASDNG